ncbi:MAG: histidinol dehydrogenase, partial [Actinomycetota bacterium]|nr:histidinol dehydrogenase [Actinomycetota bacterium]
MLARTDLRGSAPTLAELRRALPRGGTDVNAVLDTVAPLVHAVAEQGTDAALGFGEKFDGVRPTSVRVPAAVIADALDRLDPAVADALRESIARARTVHADQRRTTSRTQVVDGGVVSEKWIPVRRVGLYVPGGNAVYPSSVIMNVVPAQEAGVGSLVIASPPHKEFGG